MKIKALTLLLILFLSLIPFVKADSTQWYDTAFPYRNVYEIDSDLIDEELTDFPVLVYLNSSYVNWSRVNDDLSDLRFVSSDNVLLSHEIDSFTLNSEAWLWVKILIISNVLDTKFFMYYGSITAESVENKTDVWSNGFVGVWHMNDNSTSTILDSTNNDNDGVKKGVNEPLEISGIIGKAQEADGVNDYIQVLHDSSISITSEDFSFDFVISWSSIAGNEPFLTKGNWHQDGWYMELQGNYFIISTNQAGFDQVTISNSFVSIDIWYHISIVRSGSNITFYVNGINETSFYGSHSDPDASVRDLWIMAYDSALNVAPCSFDDIKFSKNIARSSAWVSASYETQNLNLIDLIEIETFGEESTGIAIIALMIALFSFVMVITYTHKEKK